MILKKIHITLQHAKPVLDVAVQELVVAVQEFAHVSIDFISIPT